MSVRPDSILSDSQSTHPGSRRGGVCSCGHAELAHGDVPGCAGEACFECPCDDYDPACPCGIGEPHAERDDRTLALPGVAVLALLALGLAACGPGPAAHAWRIDGPAPEAFADEADAAIAAIGISWAGTVRVLPAPFPCAAGTCAGEAYDLGHVAVAYAPELGLGPDVGSTALEHELCHAAGWWTEAGAVACASRTVAAIRGAP